MSLPFLARSTGQPIHPRGFVSPDLRTTYGLQRINLGNQLIKLKDLNPWIRNDNVTTSAVEIKVGPQAFFRNDDGTWSIWFEGEQNTGYPTNNGMTAVMKATAPTLSGPWTIQNSGNRVLDAGDNTTWENYEFSPATVLWDAANNRLIMLAHGGNNKPQSPVNRQMGVAFSTDGKVGLAWTKYGSNPVLLAGATGTFDDQQAGNDMKVVWEPDLNLWIGFYRGSKSGGTQTDGMVGRATSPDLINWTKTGQAVFAVPSWNTGGMTSGTPFRDAGGRYHMFAPTGGAAIGYIYSDDYGVSWAAPVKVAAASGVSNAYDQFGTGDVVQGVNDGDVIFLSFGVTNLTYPTNAPLRGQGFAITPWRTTNPIRKGKFYLDGAYTALTQTSLLTQTTYSIMGRFKAYRVDRTVPRYIFTEYAAFSKQVYVRIENGANGGKLGFLHRTPTALPSIVSTSTYDDGLWHTFLVRRIASGSFELYVDGGLVGTSPLDPSTDATATVKALGNWEASATTLGASNSNQPLLGTISDAGIATGYAASAAEASAWIDNRTALGGGTIILDSKTTGTDRGDVALVEAQGPATLLAIATAAETDSALGSAIALGFGLAAATNTAFAQAISLGIGVAIGTNSALAPSLALGISPAAETDQAVRAAPSLGTALETDTAFARPMVLGIGAAVGTNIALAQKLALGILPANENDAALHGGVLIAPTLETDSAFAPGRKLGILPANDNSIAFAPARKLGIAFALETDFALGPPQGPVAVPPVERIGQVHRRSRVAQVRR